jgi:hypothetical protein
MQKQLGSSPGSKIGIVNGLDLRSDQRISDESSGICVNQECQLRVGNFVQSQLKYVLEPDIRALPELQTALDIGVSQSKRSALGKANERRPFGSVAANISFLMVIVYES